MIFIRKIDEQGYFIEDDFVEEITEFTIEIPCPQGFYKPKWKFETKEWTDGATQEYIDSMKNVVAEPTLEERLQALEMLELERLLGGM